MDSTQYNLLGFFSKAYDYCLKNFLSEVNLVEARRFEDINWKILLDEYVYVVLNSGLNHKAAMGIYSHYKKYGTIAVTHEHKHKAIVEAEIKCFDWFQRLVSAEDKLAYLDSLPFIGSITKYHLARNLGLDFAKPDRHLQRLADRFGYPDVQTMCKYLSEKTGLRVGTVDVVLWRYSVSVKGE